MHHRGTDQCQCQTCDAVRSYCTFKVSDCDALFVPSDATTCNVYVPGAAVAVVGFPAPDFEEPPPQAVRLRTAAIAKTSIPRRQMTAPRDRSIHGSRSKAAIISGSSLTRLNDVVCMVVATVTVKGALLPPESGTLAG
jgi:hypothetical protein